MDVAKRQRRTDEAAAADLAPVVRHLLPAVRLQADLQAETVEAGGDLLARRVGESVIEPVVADRDGERHLADIEEVRRIPVRKRAHGLQLALAALEVLALARQPIRHREMRKAIELLARNIQQTFADLLALEDGFVEQVIRPSDHAPRGIRIRRSRLLQINLSLVKVLCGRKQTRMRQLRRILNGLFKLRRRRKREPRSADHSKC